MFGPRATTPRPKKAERANPDRLSCAARRNGTLQASSNALDQPHTLREIGRARELWMSAAFDPGKRAEKRGPAPARQFSRDRAAARAGPSRIRGARARDAIASPTRSADRVVAPNCRDQGSRSSSRQRMISPQRPFAPLKRTGMVRKARLFETRDGPGGGGGGGDCVRRAHFQMNGRSEVFSSRIEYPADSENRQ